MRLSLIFCAVAAMASACTSTPPKASCATIDWYEIGRRDGSIGETPEKFQTRTSGCQGAIDEKYTIQYLSGRNAGIVSYCEADNGWETGRSGKTYKNVCPYNLEPEFLRLYHLGTKAYSLAKQNAEISEEIDLISHRLRMERLDMRQKYLLTAQLEQLKNDQEALSRRLDQLQEQISIH